MAKAKKVPVPIIPAQPQRTSQDQCQEPEEYEDEDTYDDRMNQKEQCRNPNHGAW